MRRANYESRRGCVILMVLSLQAFGLAVLMARAGLAIPAEAPVQVPAYSAVLADIGDEQSLSANLSTFSGHLRRIQVKRLLLFSHPCTFFCFVCCYWFSVCMSSSQVWVNLTKCQALQSIRAAFVVVLVDEVGNATEAM